VLKKDRLEYYADEESFKKHKEPRGHFPLTPDLVVEKKKGEGSHGSSSGRFSLVQLSGLKLKLQADDERDANEWVESIRVSTATHNKSM